MNLSHLARQLIKAADEQDRSSRQFIVDAANTAANIQTIAQFVIHSASDIASVQSILNASDSGSTIAMLSKQAAETINKAAYNAELCSQTAMETSASVSEIPSGYVVDEAKAIKTLLDKYLQIKAQVNMLDTLTQLKACIDNTLQNFEIVNTTINKANLKAKVLLQEIKQLSDQISQSAKLIHQLNDVIVKKKGKNELLSPVVVDAMNTAVQDIDHAIALAAIALNLVTTINENGKTLSQLAAAKNSLTKELYHYVLKLY